MNKLLIIISFLSIFTSGCAEWWDLEEVEYPLHYHLDSNSPYEMQVGVYEAANDWNDLAVRHGLEPMLIYEGEVNSKFKSDKRFDVIVLNEEQYASEDNHTYLGKCRTRFTKKEARVDILFAPHSNIIRWAGDGNSVIDAYYTIALHELGHALGLGHVLDDRELMYYYARNMIDFPNEITAEAEEKFCEIHRCKK
jgi:hypothetical protein